MRNYFFQISTAFFIVTGLVVISALIPTPRIQATVAEDLQLKIQERNNLINQLNEQIRLYQQQIDKTSAQARTLQNSIKVLNTTQQKLATDIKVTENKIDSTSLTIQQLENKIEEKEDLISTNKAALANAIRNIDNVEQTSLIESMLQYSNMSSFWNEYETLQKFQTSVRENTDKLKELKLVLEENKSANESQKTKLLDYKSELSDKKKVVDVNKSQTNQLLSTTKNQESAYQKLLKEQQTRKEAFEKELREFESQLKLAVDPNSVPKAGNKVLAPPLAKLIVTQEFGDTAFSRTQAIYNGKGHSGTDFKASMGTPVFASLDGVVAGAGDTDPVCYKASYGKWILITHPNGLSTLYGHLSVISVSPGQSVKTGDRIGLTGNSGYTTGPHLHYSVYNSTGVKVMSVKSKACNGTYTMPVSDLKAYLNPMLYL